MGKEMNINFEDEFEGVEILELNESKALSETAASSGISSCNNCSYCLSTSCCSDGTII